MGGGLSKAPDGFSEMNFDKTKQFDITIQYCGGWGYGKYAEYSRKLILEAYPSAKVAVKKDNGTTGNMEVTHVASGQKVHSKKGGDGQISESNALAMIQKLQALVEDQ